MRILKQKVLTVLGGVMITALLITIFVAYSYADPVSRSTENQEYEERYCHDPDEHHERHDRWEEEHNDVEEYHHHHHDEIEEERYRNHGCH
jgi:Ni/Co efflux regulator RcnB